MKKQFLIFVIFFLAVNVESQIKYVRGDTAYWYKYTEPILKTIGATDFIKSQDDFSFRFRDHGQVVQIIKNNDSIQGTLVNYIFKLGKKDRTIFTKTIINDSIAIKAYDLINKSGVLELDSDNKIDGWGQGCDGITYFIEHADKENYWYKTFWTPSAQDSLKEALIVNDFVNSLSELLELEKNYEIFEQNLPHNGCYSSGGMTRICYIPNNYALGYSGSANLPLGYIVGANIGYIANKEVDFGISISHQFDRNRYYDFSAIFIKGSLLFPNCIGLNDYISYNYRQRKYEDIKKGTKFINHKLLYGLRLKTTFLGVGVDFLNGEKWETGGLVSFNQYIPKSKLTVSSKVSIFKNHFDYVFETSKVFHLNSIKPINGINVGIYYENFTKHGNAGLSFRIML